MPEQQRTAPYATISTPGAPAAGSHDRETLLGLYHGYDRARVALGRLAGQIGRTATDGPPPGLSAARNWTHAAAPLTERARLGRQRGSQAAALAAFALVSDQAETLRRELCQRWPELRHDLGGPLPTRSDDPEASHLSAEVGGSGAHDFMEPRGKAR